MTTKIVVPEMGESVVGATIARWLKREGDRVNAGETVVELETEKVDLEMGAEKAGILTRINRHEGDEVKVGETLAEIEEGAPQTQAPPPPRAEVPGRPAAVLPRDADSGDGKEAPALEAPAPDSAPVQEAPRREVAPLPTPGGHARPVAALRSEREERVRMSRRRQTIARRLVEAQHTAAMLTTFNEVDMSAVLALRARHRERFTTRYGVGLGITSFFVKASIGALKAFPRLNAEIQGDEMVLKHYFDIGIAVGASEGLVVPVLRDADRLSFATIETTIKEFGRKAEEGTLSLDDLRGGTFTITNGGVFGSLLSTPILNPPQVGILGLHKIEERPIVRQGAVVVAPMMYVSLSYDHRIVDGREAVQFLVRVKELIEDPAGLLLEA
jgi:2-oxoglutarate dehydrogenase E2 component (dihydrolipoamide succinyltransferase)